MPAVTQPASHGFGNVLLTELTQPADEGIRCVRREEPVEHGGEASRHLYQTLVEPSIEAPRREKKRRKLVADIELLFQAWVGAVQPRLAPFPAKGFVYVFGSLRLGLHLSDADVDMLMAVGTAAQHVDLRHLFFSSFPAALERGLGVKDCTVVGRAVVPVLKVRHLGVSLDIAFAALSKLTEHDQFEEAALDPSVDERTAQSVSGVLNGEAVFRAIPNLTAFWVAARALKLWATRRRVYGGMYGYLSGGTLAILVARAAQLQPFASPAELLLKVLQEWHRLTGAALEATGKEEDPEIVTVSVAGFERRDLLKLGPLLYVVNPAYPHTNNARLVLKAQAAHMHEECARAVSLLAEGGRLAPHVGADDFRRLVEPAAFFTNDRMYVEVVFGATTREVFSSWAGYVATRMRLFADELCVACGNAQLLAVQLSPPRDEIGVQHVAAHVSTHLVAVAPSDGSAAFAVAVREVAHKFRRLLKDLLPVAGVVGPLVRTHTRSSVPTCYVRELEAADAEHDHPAPPGAVSPCPPEESLPTGLSLASDSKYDASQGSILADNSLPTTVADDEPCSPQGVAARQQAAAAAGGQRTPSPEEVPPPAKRRAVGNGVAAMMAPPPGL